MLYKILQYVLLNRATIDIVKLNCRFDTQYSAIVLQTSLLATLSVSATSSTGCWQLDIDVNGNFF